MKLRTRKKKGGSTSWFIDYREGGQRHQKTLKGVSNPEMAQLAFAQWIKRRELGEVGLPTDQNLTLRECLDSYLDSRRGSTVERHFSTQQTRAREALDFFGKNATVASLVERKVKRFVDAMKAKGNAPPTINRKLQLLKASIAKAVHEGKVARNPLDGVSYVSDRRDPVYRFLTKDEAERLLSVLKNGSTITVKRSNGRNYQTHVEGPRGLYPLVFFLLHTGARLSEAHAVKWEDIDFEAGNLRLVTRKRASRGRAAKARLIPMNPALRAFLEDLPREGAKLFRPNTGNLQHQFARAVELAGIGHCRIHDLRHSFASFMAKAGVPLNTIRELLGHSTLTMTLRYSHVDAESAVAAVNAIPLGEPGEGAKILAVAEGGKG